MSTQGIKGSRRGVAVQGALPYQLNYDSNKNVWKYKQVFTGSTTITLTGGDYYGQVSIALAHDLGYKPQLFGFYKTDLYGGELIKIPGQEGWYKGFVFDITESGYTPGINTSYINFQFQQGSLSSTTSVDIDYVAFILIEPEVDPWHE